MWRLLLCALVLLAGPASAQKTGGSFGGGSFDDDVAPATSGSSRTGAGPGSSQGSGSSSAFPETPTPEAPAAWEDRRTAEEIAEDERREAEWRAREEAWRAAHRDAGGVVLTADEVRAFERPSLLRELMWPHGTIGFGALLAFLVPAFVRRRAGAPGEQKGARGAEPAHVARVSVAFDWTARSKLQDELAALSHAVDLRTPALRQRAVERLVRVIKKNGQAARYAAWSQTHLPVAEASEHFARLARELRNRFQFDLVRGVEAPDKLRARAREGEGLVVLTLLVGRRGRGVELPEQTSERTLPAVLKAVSRGGSVSILEVIWSPAAEQDRMSSAELEVVYPELKLLQPQRLGRVSCPSCTAVFAAELERCPSCGDDAPGANAKAVHAGPCPYCNADMPKYETMCERCGAWVAAGGQR